MCTSSTWGTCLMDRDVHEQYLGHVSKRQGCVRAVLGARVEETGTSAEPARPLLTSAARVHWYASCAPNADFKGIQHTSQICSHTHVQSCNK